MRSLLAVAALLLVPSVARAEGDFPSTIVSHLAIQCPNPIWDGNGCTLCHQNDFGGCGSATKPLGAWLKQQGLTCSTLSPKLLGELLDQAKAEGVDTNCDGVPDIEQLESAGGKISRRPRRATRASARPRSPSTRRMVAHNRAEWTAVRASARFSSPASFFASGAPDDGIHA